MLMSYYNFSPLILALYFFQKIRKALYDGRVVSMTKTETKLNYEL